MSIISINSMCIQIESVMIKDILRSQSPPLNKQRFKSILELCNEQWTLLERSGDLTTLSCGRETSLQPRQRETAECRETRESDCPLHTSLSRGREQLANGKLDLDIWKV